MKGPTTQVTLTLIRDIIVRPIFSHKSINIAQITVISQNSAYGHFEGQGHLGHVTPRLTWLVIEH